MEAQIPIPFENTTIIFIVMILCVLFVAFFSSSEAALISVNRIRIRNLIEKGNRAAKAVDRIVSKHDRLFATILTTENMFIILASSLAGVLAVSLMGERGILVSSLLMTMFIVIFGEITPKTFAAQNAVKVSLVVARPMEKIIYILSPVISLLSFISMTIIRLLGGSHATNPYILSEDEIKTAISDAVTGGFIAKSEKAMIEGIFEFNDTIAQEIMVPRVEMVTVDHEAGLDKVIDLINRTGHSRIPVYEQNVDHIVGAVYAKDILKSRGESMNTLCAKDIMRPCHFAPASQKVMAMLSELRTRKTSLAIIIDEFGGTAGMITIETLLEQIVGEIEDEFDINIPKFEKISETEYIVDARMNIYDLKENLGIELPEGDYQTVGGFVINLVETIPSQGDIVTFDNYDFIVEKTEGCKLSRIRIQRTRKARKRDGK